MAAKCGGMFIPKRTLFYKQPRDVISIRLMSDLHIGAQNVDYKLIRKEVDKCIELDRRICINGDVFDAIVGFDRRATPDVLHPRLSGRRDPHNEAIIWAAELFEGAEHLIDFIGCGNHETSIEKYSGVDLIKLLIHELSKKNSEINFGGYSGWMVYSFALKDKVKTNDKLQRLSIYYHHGAGGTAPVTKGMINFNRKLAFIETADVIWFGHHHNRTVADEWRMGLSTHNRPYHRRVLLAQTGCYFNTYDEQTQESYKAHGRISNYAADAGRRPDAKGGVTLEVTLTSGEGGNMEVTGTI